MDKKLQFNYGYFDALADRESKRRNRVGITQGQLYCLPAWNKAYCKGYRKGFNPFKDQSK